MSGEAQGAPRPAAPVLPALDSASIPRATYRVQFNAGFRFADAQAVVPYLAALGISHLYASPILKARPGSTHGYDAIDPDALNPEIGDDASFARLTDCLASHGMQLLLDIVPNHMGVLEADNAWWLDVLENGPAAQHASAFDIEWAPPQRELQGRLLLAVLGRPYGEVLEAGEIRPLFEPARGQVVLHYFGHRFPLDPADHAALLRSVPLPADASPAEQAQVDSLLHGFARLPRRDAADPVDRATRQREAAALKQALSALHAAAAWAPAWLDACAATLQGEPGRPDSFDALDALLQRQAYRLAHWRAAGDVLNYRRFFDVNALAGLRIEEPAVFEAVHRRIFGWLASGQVAGLRIDHPDGMADPEAYFQRLQQRCCEVRQAAGQPAVATYIVVEKILAEGEPWPRDWPVHGDTGYRFSNQVNGLFVDAEQAAAFDALYAGFVGSAVDFDAELDAAKRSTMALSLAAELRLLTELAHDIALQHRHTRDLTRNGISAAIAALAAAFDVYRSYVSERGAGPLDRARIEKCTAAARASCRPSQAVYIDFVRQLLLQPVADAALRRCQLRFVQRLQQFTAPVMAKAMEDTAFYRHHRLLSLNDVGGDPRRFGTEVAAFHAANLARLREMPHTLLGGSTHDSKRSEDVRTRLDVLSEMPARWAATLQRWRELAQTQWRIGNQEQLPAANDELLLFQTLLAIWPPALADDAALTAVRERVSAYMLKAVREAKQQSSWLDGNDSYEQAVQRCTTLLLARLEPNPFVSDLRRVVAEVAPFGACNSLAQVALKLTSPGVPDIYQGNEALSLALVDPDNRRPVDYAALQAGLEEVQRLHAAGDAAAALQRLPPDTGPHKLFVTWRLLQWRAAAPALFRDGDYRPLQLEGPAAAGLVAFARCNGPDCSITLVPRLPWRASGGDLARLLSGDCWGGTLLLLPPELPDSGWQDALCGRPVPTALPHATAGATADPAAPAAPAFAILALPVAALLQGLPVAVLRVFT